MFKKTKNIKNHFYVNENFKKVRMGGMGKVKSSGGSQKISKKSFMSKKNQKLLLCQVAPVCNISAQGTPRWKISKSHFFVQKNLGKSPGSQMRYICSIRSNMCDRLRQQGGSQMRYVCSIRSNMCHMVEAAGWEPDAVHFRNWCLDVAKVFKKCDLDAIPF